MVSRHTASKGESWKVRACEPKGCVQAWTAEVTGPRVDRVVADKAQTCCPPFDFTQGGEQVEPRLEGLGPWFLDTYELLNNLTCHWVNVNFFGMFGDIDHRCLISCECRIKTEH